MHFNTKIVASFTVVVLLPLVSLVCSPQSPKLMNAQLSHVHVMSHTFTFQLCTQAKVQLAQAHKLNHLVPTHQTAGEVKTSATGTATP